MTKYCIVLVSLFMERLYFKDDMHSMHSFTFQDKPEVLEYMLSKLAQYNANMVPPQNPKADLQHSDPAKHGGSWEPWM